MKRILTTALSLCVMASAFGQNSYTKEQILNMTVDELAELPLEDLMAAVETLGVTSVDELFAMIMNKNVSSASKKEEDSFKSPLSSTVITKAEMRTYGISTLEEAFRLIPGMIVTEKTNGMYDIQMRGLNNIPDNNMFLYTENANTLIMVDGRPAQSYVVGSTDSYSLPISIEDVERIEVVRGACGALYGANAVSGVINIITSKPNYDSPLISGSFQMGSLNTYVGDIALRKAINDKIAVGVTFNMQYRERNTDKLYVIPGQSGLFYCTNTSAVPAPSVQTKTPYYYGYLNPADGTFTPATKPDGSLGTVEEFMTAYAQYKQTFACLTDVDANKSSIGGYYSVDELENFKQLYPGEYDANGNIISYRLFDALEPETPARAMFPNPELSRDNVGINGYITLTPNPDVTINISGGYQNAQALTTPVGDDIFSLNGRSEKSGYSAIEASVKDLHILANYKGGVGNYAVGVPGFKIRFDEVNLGAEYDIFVGDLNIRPGLAYQHMIYKDYVPEWTDKATHQWEYKDPGYRYQDAMGNSHLSGFLYYGGTLKTLAPSLRLDYQKDDLRLIGAFRADKTNIPDKWQYSWQLAASYSLNENNFLRFVYGRANRGTNLVNSTADFDWTRTDMVYPRYLHFEKNEDAPLVKIDNFEVGYRLKPAQNILVDAEAFFSISDQFGALMANDGEMLVSSAEMQKVVTSVATSVAMMKMAGYSVDQLVDPNVQKLAILSLVGKADMGTVLDPFASIKYKELPYKVKQAGISVNIDYIISSKLIAKLNANYQHTVIDNYFEYSQTNDVKALLEKATARAFNYSVDPSATGYDAYTITGEIPEAFSQMMNDYVTAYNNNGGDYQNIWREVAASIFQNYDSRRDGCFFGKTSADELPREYRDGHVHKGTPAYYGMIGLIYKPLQQLEVSAFGNYISKRTTKLKYGSAELGQRFTLNAKIGYKPVQDFELFFNAHNLLNNKKREFAHTDEIGGLYTFGINFHF